MSGTITNMFIKVGHGKPMKAVDEVRLEDGRGIVGDLSFDRKKRQVLVIDETTLDYFGLEPGQVRENLTVSGLELTGLSAGSILQAGPVQLEVIGDCAPCQQIEDIRPGLKAEMESRRGLLCIVNTGGGLNVGDKIQIVP